MRFFNELLPIFRSGVGLSKNTYRFYLSYHSDAFDQQQVSGVDHSVMEGELMIFNHVYTVYTMYIKKKKIVANRGIANYVPSVVSYFFNSHINCFVCHRNRLYTYKIITFSPYSHVIRTCYVRGIKTIIQ